ncbi:MAG: hypothetical protein VCA36_04915 [Opitutales bacterium]
MKNFALAALLAFISLKAEEETDATGGGKVRRHEGRRLRRIRPA